MFPGKSDIRGTKVLEFTSAKLFFEVFETAATDGYPYVGYCDGERSISASCPDVAARGLERKHVYGLPEGKLLKFPTRTT